MKDKYCEGNLLNSKKYGIGEVYGTTPDTVTLKIIETGNYLVRNKTDISPIPLDAEWLERFLFKQVKLDRTPFYELAIENIKFLYCDGNLDFGVMGVSQYEFVKMPKISYVHQLQNLYYCLTGTELTKKEI